LVTLLSTITPTYYDYTISLHDALPIWRRDRRQRRHADPLRPARRRECKLHNGPRPKRSNPMCPWPTERTASAGPRYGWARYKGRDRKSTRLNSSHEWISYAAFCLEQKR